MHSLRVALRHLAPSLGDLAYTGPFVVTASLRTGSRMCWRTLPPARPRAGASRVRDYARTRVNREPYISRHSRTAS
jgi:hypothetical protein